MVIGIETDRGLFVSALVATGYQVYAVNPMSTSRYRDRHSTSGAKSDPGDAKVLSDMVRTDRHNHRPVAGDSETVEAVKVLARAHRSMIWSRSRQTNGLRSTLREFYPAALVAFENLASGDAIEVLKLARTMPHCDRSGTDSSASCTDALPTGPSTTNSRPGPTVPRTISPKPLDKLGPWDVYASRSWSSPCPETTIRPESPFASGWHRTATRRRPSSLRPGT